MVHSSLSSIGFVEGGAKTIGDCLLDVLGNEGTLVVPTFTYPSAFTDSADAMWVFDPSSTNSGVGSITNEVIRRSSSRRSIHLWHSVSAIGPLSELIVSAGRSSAWDFDSPMSWILSNGGSFESKIKSNVTHLIIKSKNSKQTTKIKNAIEKGISLLYLDELNFEL